MLTSGTESPRRSTLRSRNVSVQDHRTSMRLEPEMWDALAAIAKECGLSINALVSRIEAARKQSSLTSAVRVFTLSYYRYKAEIAAMGGEAPRDALLQRLLG